MPTPHKPDRTLAGARVIVPNRIAAAPNCVCYIDATAAGGDGECPLYRVRVADCPRVALWLPRDAFEIR